MLDTMSSARRPADGATSGGDTGPDEPYGDPTTRARILDAAWDLVETGQDVAMGAVARRAGVSRQAVYLHVGDRTGLLVALVDHMDRSLGLDERAREVFTAPSAVDALERLVAMLTVAHGRIAGVARVLDAARLTDPDARAAWDDRMRRRVAGSRHIVQRLADEGRLAAGWDVGSAGDLLYALTLPAGWDALVGDRGWDAEAYRDRLTTVLRAVLVRPD